MFYLAVCQYQITVVFWTKLPKINFQYIWKYSKVYSKINVVELILVLDCTFWRDKLFYIFFRPLLLSKIFASNPGCA